MIRNVAFIGWPFRTRRRFCIGMVAVLLLLAAAYAGAKLWGAYHLRAARKAIVSGDLEAARDHAARCLAVRACGPEAYVIAARVERLANDRARAEELLMTANRLYGDSVGSQLEQILLDVQRGNFRRHEMVLRTYVTGDSGQLSDLPAALEVLSACYFTDHRYVDACQMLDKWLDIQPDCVRARKQRGHLAMSAGRSEVALLDFEHACNADPQDVSVRLNLLTLYLEAGLVQKVDSHVEFLRQNHPELVDVKYFQARNEELKGNVDRAIVLYNEVLETKPNHAPTLLSLARVQVKGEQVADAEKTVRRLVECDPANEHGWGLLHSCLVQQGRKPEESAAALQQYIILHEKSQKLATLLERETLGAVSQGADNPYQIGMLYMEGGKNDAAIAWLQTALRRDPSHRPSHQALAEYYGRVGKKDKAKVHGD